MYNFLLGFIAAIFVSTQAFAGDPVILFADDDPELHTAMAKARDSLPGFLNFIASGSDNMDGFGLKVAFQGDTHVEHIWVAEVVDHGEGRFSGRLANAPDQLGRLRIGDKVTFFDHQISDWSLVRDGKGYGFYTVRVMAAYMTPDQAGLLRGFLSDTPVPAEW